MAAIVTKPQTSQIADPDTGKVNQTWATQLNAVFENVAGPFPLRSFAKATLPDPAKYAFCIVYVPDDVGGACAAISDGTSWKKITLGATVS